MELSTDDQLCCRLENGGVIGTNAFKSGFFHVQDISSQICCEVLAPTENDVVLDICAAPGGKTFTMAEMMNGRGEIHAFDLHEKRVKLISEGAERLGLPNISAKSGDASVYNEDIPKCTKILCDVPCSGFGVISHKPEIKYKSEEECIGLPYVQLEILKTAAKYLKKGGRMVYSTCTVFENENIEVVNRFLKENPNFVPVNIDVLDINETNYTFLPPQSIGDGFFIAVFERK